MRHGRAALLAYSIGCKLSTIHVSTSRASPRTCMDNTGNRHKLITFDATCVSVQRLALRNHPILRGEFCLPSHTVSFPENEAYSGPCSLMLGLGETSMV